MSFLRRSLVLCRPAIGNGDTREIKQRRDRGVDPAWVDSIARKPGEIDETVSHSIAYFFFSRKIRGNRRRLYVDKLENAIEEILKT